jgi:hypothetical protein
MRGPSACPAPLPVQSGLDGLPDANAHAWPCLVALVARDLRVIVARARARARVAPSPALACCLPLSLLNPPLTHTHRIAHWRQHTSSVGVAWMTVPEGQLESARTACCGRRLPRQIHRSNRLGCFVYGHESAIEKNPNQVGFLVELHGDVAPVAARMQHTHKSQCVSGLNPHACWRPHACHSASSIDIALCTLAPVNLTTSLLHSASICSRCRHR